MKPVGQAPEVPVALVEVLIDTCPAPVPITAAVPAMFLSLAITLVVEEPGVTEP